MPVAPATTESGVSFHFWPPYGDTSVVDNHWDRLPTKIKERILSFEKRIYTKPTTQQKMNEKRISLAYKFPPRDNRWDWLHVELKLTTLVRLVSPGP